MAKTKQKRQKDKQWSTKHCTENYILNNTNTTKTRCKLRFSRRVSSSCPTSGTRRTKRQLTNGKGNEMFDEMKLNMSEQNQTKK